MAKLNAKELIEAHDKEQRIQAEADILGVAHALTNGSAGNPKLQGQVLEWVVKETIDNGALLRTIADELPELQRKSECALDHENKKWHVKIFGNNFAMPTTVAVLVMGWLIFLFLRKQGWI